MGRERRASQAKGAKPTDDKRLEHLEGAEEGKWAPVAN